MVNENFRKLNGIPPFFQTYVIYISLFSQKGMKKEFKVKGMHCRSCETLITDSLLEEKGMKHVQASFPKGTVIIESDGVSDARIKEIIKKEGYEAL